MATATLTDTNLTRGTLGSSWSRTGLQIVEGSRGYSRGNPSTAGTQPRGKPRGAKAKLPRSCRQLFFRHDFLASHPGYADAGVTHVKVVSGGPTAELHLERRTHEKALSDWGPTLALIDEVIDQNRIDLTQGARVLELGCGMGLPGMVCAAVGAEVVLTDDAAQAEILYLAEENAKFNFMGPGKRPPGPGSGRASVRPLTWGQEEAEAILADFGHFDLVICADCVYQPLYGKKSWLALADSLEVLTGPDTKTLFTIQRRSEDGVEGFLSYMIEDLHLLVQQLPVKKHMASGVEIYSVRRPSRQEIFHVDIQSSAEHEDFQTIVDAWRGVKPSGF